MLRLEPRQPEHRSTSRHNPRLFIGQREQPLQAADDAANPTAGRVVHHRPARVRHDVTHGEHVLRWKIDVQVAVGMRRIGDVSVTNARVELTGCVEGLVGLRDLRRTGETTAVPGPGDVGRQPQPRVLMRDDRPAGLAERLVQPGLLGVPMGIEDRVNPAALRTDLATDLRQSGDGVHQRIDSRRRSPIDEHDAIGRGVRDDVSFSRDRHDEQVVAEPQNICALIRTSGDCLHSRRSKALNRRGGNDAGGAQRGLQDVPTCVMALVQTRPAVPSVGILAAGIHLKHRQEDLGATRAMKRSRPANRAADTTFRTGISSEPARARRRPTPRSSGCCS